MAMMAKMRSLAPWFIITVGGLFVLFMVLSDSRVLDALGMQRSYIGEINGEPVQYEEFSSFVETARRNQEAQTGREIAPEQMDMFRDQVWNAMVNQRLIDEKIDELNIVVTDDEIREKILGPNPPAYLKQGFIDSAGNFNRQQYQQAIMDPRNRENLIMVEERMRQELVQQKLQSYLTASIVVSQAEIKKEFVDQNIEMSTRHVMVPATIVPDSSVKVTDADIQNYYDENKADYKIDPQRKLNYVLFRTVPAEGDTTLVRDNLEAIVEDLKSDTASFRTYVNIYSDQPFSVDTLSLARIPGEAGSRLLDAEEGSIVGPVLTPRGYVVYKLNDKIRGSQTFVHASHILINTGENRTAEQAEELASQLYDRINNGEDFAELAKEYSSDPGSAVRGGDLGWFGKGQMVPEFEKASFGAKEGEVTKPVKTDYGYHIIKVHGKSSQELVVERIVNQIKMSATTEDKIYQKAQDFAYLADKNNFEAEAELVGYQILQTPAFTEKQSTIPGIGANKALSKFAFENSVGDLSDVYKTAAGYVVAEIAEATEERYKPLSEVETSIRRSLIADKKAAEAMNIAAEIKSKVGDNGDLNQAKEVNSKVRIGGASDFKAGGNIPGIGRDYAYAAYALEAPLDKISDPIKGQRGAYLIEVTERTDFDSAKYNLQKNLIRDQLLRQKQASFYTQWIENLREEADIVDNRHRFYR